MEAESHFRLRWLLIILASFWGVIIIRLFDVQVLQHQELNAEAKTQHEKRSVLPARRGKILVKKNYLSDDVVPLATNNTLKMLFIDPLILAYPRYNHRLDITEQKPGDPRLVAQLLAPLLINAHCEKTEGCIATEDNNQEGVSAIERTATLAYQAELEKLFGQLEKNRLVIETGLSAATILAIKNLQLDGVWTEGGSVIADPTRIIDRLKVAKNLSAVLNLDAEKLAASLKRRPIRYQEIVHKIVPEVAEKILQLKEDPQYRQILRGVQLRDEHWRYYPEKNLAAQVLGFVDSQGLGQYGIEGRMDAILKGEEGQILGATNTSGQRIISAGSSIKQAKDGKNVLLTIDRVIQGQVEKILTEDLHRFEADFGQVLVIEPQTGHILAMAQAPTFDPNEFGKVFTTYEITPEQKQFDAEDEEFNHRIPTVAHKGRYYRYFNTWGEQVFRNKTIADTYEPGSVLKAITMAVALEANEVTPEMTFEDTGPVEVDEFKIRNSDEHYAGTTNMIEVLARSLNTGIAFLAQKLGPQSLYEALKNFGFSQYTDIELDGENAGQLEFWSDWSESELVTRGFGQGMTATPLQVAMAFSALANGGNLLKPLLVEKIITSDGQVIKENKPKIVRRVLSDQTYNTIKSMLKNAVSSGIGRGARVFGYSIMGKTGTSQTYKNGKVLQGEGTTITSFAGFGPFKEPKFVILVKYDYPRTSQWGSETAAGTFRKIAEFLFQYFSVPPDR